jgi:hypothetical protein
MTGPGGPTGDDRPPDPFADGPGDERSLAVSIPDDARELAADVTAYRKELRARRRRERFDKYTLARYWRPYGIPFPVVIASLIVVGAVGGLLLALLPNPGQPTHVPLASTTLPPGQRDGLLPDVAVRVDTATKSSRDLRPAVLAIVPSNCGCADTIQNVASQAGEFALQVYVVTSQAADPQIDAITSTSGDSVTAVYDSSRVMQQTYTSEPGVTVVFVRKDGVVKNWVQQVGPKTSLHGALSLIDPSQA